MDASVDGDERSEHPISDVNRKGIVFQRLGDDLVVVLDGHLHTDSTLERSCRVGHSTFFFALRANARFAPSWKKTMSINFARL